jgi:hypothetical protein
MRQMNRAGQDLRILRLMIIRSKNVPLIITMATVLGVFYAKTGDFSWNP